MWSDISWRVTDLEQPELGQVLVCISPISVPRKERMTILLPQPGLASLFQGNSPIIFMAPKRTTMVFGASRPSLSGPSSLMPSSRAPK